MKNKYKIITLIVGLLLIAGCGNEAETVTNPSVEEIESTSEYEIVGTEEQNEKGNVSETEIDSEAWNGSQESMENQEDTVSQETADQEAQLTLENFLKTALLPVGNTMYIWGGGWNEEDTGAGPGATTIGVCPDWESFYVLQDENYNYKEHRYEIMNGLDCSGYVGWVVYNCFEEESGKEGYVFKSTETAAKYSELGWGELLEAPEEFLTGDIVSMKGHVWISLGMCEDGSVVLMHASPPGVSICGTALDVEKGKTEGGKESQAVVLAKAYMEKYYPKWQEAYPDREVGTSYTNNVTVLRWNEDALVDAEELQEMSAEEVLKLLFEE